MAEGLARARNIFRVAARNGTLVRQPCEVCGTEVNINGHHEDYSKPLDVMWLCRPHHIARHKELGWGMNGRRKKGALAPMPPDHKFPPPYERVYVYKPPRGDEHNMEPMKHIRTAVFGMSQSTFAEAINVNQSTVSRWESWQLEPDRSHMQSIIEIAAEQNIPFSVDWFFA